MKDGDKITNRSVETLEGTCELYSLMHEHGIILYFYPKDNTSGCTAEACDFRDNFKIIQDLGYNVVGVSPDSLKSHSTFKEKNNLPFTLIADTEHQLAEECGVWREKSMYGKKYWGIHRSTYIVNHQGIVVHAWHGVSVPQHTQEVIDYVRNMHAH